MKEQFLEEIIRLYSDYSDFLAVTLEKQKELDGIKKAFGASDTPPVEAIKEYTNIYVDFVSFNSELSSMGARLAYYIDLFVKIGNSELPEPIAKFYADRKGLLKQAFVVRDGKIVEAEEGVLEERRKQFYEQDFYKNMQKMLS